MSENSDFRRVTFDKERERILSDLQSKSIVLAGLTGDNQQFLFNVRKVRGAILYVEAVAPVARPLARGEPLQVLFGLSDGLYLLNTRVESAEEPFLVDFGSELYRLQRRNNFRTSIPAGMRVLYTLLRYKGDVIPPMELAPLDLSAGGVRVTWPVQKWQALNKIMPHEGDALTGTMYLPNGKSLEISGKVKNLFSMENGRLDIGIEFQNLSVRDEQALLFICMQIHREQAPLIK